MKRVNKVVRHKTKIKTKEMQMFNQKTNFQLDISAEMKNNSKIWAKLQDIYTRESKELLRGLHIIYYIQKILN